MSGHLLQIKLKLQHNTRAGVTRTTMPNTPLCPALLNQSSCVSLKSFFRLTILVSFLISYFMQDSKTASERELGTLGFPCCCVVCCAVVGVVYVVGAFGSMMKPTVLGSCSAFFLLLLRLSCKIWQNVARIWNLNEKGAWQRKGCSQWGGGGWTAK